MRSKIWPMLIMGLGYYMFRKKPKRVQSMAITTLYSALKAIDRFMYYSNRRNARRTLKLRRNISPERI